MGTASRTRALRQATMLARVAAWLNVSPDDLAALPPETLANLDQCRAITLDNAAWQREQDEAERRGE